MTMTAKKNLQPSPSHTVEGHSYCPIRQVLDRLGDKWSLLIISSLSQSPTLQKRFSEIKRDIEGISQRMLTTTLRNLERDGLLKREVFPQIPPRVEYTLTNLGKSLMVPVQSLLAWVNNYWPEIESAREKFDQNKPELR